LLLSHKPADTKLNMLKGLLLKEKARNRKKLDSQGQIESFKF
jgi:hypothetical protein